MQKFEEDSAYLLKTMPDATLEQIEAFSEKVAILIYYNSINESIAREMALNEIK